MFVQSTVELAAATTVVFPFVADLDRYPDWMPLVYVAQPVGDSAWMVELRAKVGPFARSKRLRMERTLCVQPESASSDAKVIFERKEVDGKKHSPWILTVNVRAQGSGSQVDVELEYKGSLWTGGVLEQVLHNNINAGREGLRRVTSNNS
jgi:carbon monoxide dehydrogenase subunit G